MSNFRIEAKDLGKQYNFNIIFKGIDYSFKDNQFYCITGHNGEGKSTLLQVLTGMVSFEKGVLNYFLSDTKIPAEHWFKHISTATPYQDLPEEFTAEELFIFHFKFKEKLITDLSFDQFVDILHLKNIHKKPIKEFSTGMKQRLKLGLALYSKSNVLFLDEPTSNLDEQGTHWFLGEIDKHKGSRLIIMSSNLKVEYQRVDIILDISAYKN